MRTQQTGRPDDGLPACTTCNNLRRVRVPPAAPGPNGELSRLDWCPDCGHLARRQHRLTVYRRKRDRIEKYSQKIGRYACQTFETFNQRQEEKSTALVRKAYQAALAFSQAPQGWLVLYGPKGTGKSHLAAAIANHLETLPEDERPLVMFLTAPDLLDLLRSGYRAGDYDELLTLCREVDLLILDDLGVEQGTDWATEKLFQIVNYRYQTELPTVVVTNHRLEELESRIRDRLSDDDLCTKFQIVAPTYRQRSSAPGTIVQ
jgi:DNA replication protein DnaC